MQVSALPHGQAFFCDDVRQEIGNKLSLIGVYSGTMEFAPEIQFPIIIAKLCIVVYWHEALDTTVNEIAFRVYFADMDADPYSDEGLLLAESIVKVQEAQFRAPDLAYVSKAGRAASKTIGTVVSLSPLPLPSAGKLRVRVFRDGEPWMAGSLRIHNATPDVSG